MPNLPLRRFVTRHAGAALREIGVLLLAFTPLDVTLSDGEHGWNLLLFVVAGAILFTGGMVLDWRSRDVV